MVAPPTGEAAYEVAADTFINLWPQVTGHALNRVSPENAPTPGDVVLIGSDAVNPIVHDLIKRGVLETLNLQYGTDGYRLLSVDAPPVCYLIVAGGRGPDTKLIQCICGWGGQHDAAAVLADPEFAEVGMYGFAKPDPETTLPPEDNSGNARNIAAMREAFTNKSD